MGVQQISNAAEFKSQVLGAGAGKLVMVDFYATWCGPCKMIAPKVEAMSEEFPDVAFFKVDVDQVSEVSEEQGVSAMPTFFFFKDGKKVGEVVGASEDKIRDAIVKNK